MLSLFGCGGPKYKLNFDGYGFESKKTEYAEGARVTVRYDIIATDTDYTFFIDPDVEMKRDYDGGYVFTFTMPAHDVTIHVTSRNSMEYIPEVEQIPEEELAAELDNAQMVFDYYEATVATVGGDGYDEMVLYRRPEGNGLILAKYSKWEGDETESMQLCLVRDSYLDECMRLVKQYKMEEWKDGIGLNGKEYVVKFLQGDTIIRISSENMPEDGRAAFEEIAATLQWAWDEYAPSR